MRLSVLMSFEPAPLPDHLVFHPIPQRNAVLRDWIDSPTPRLRKVPTPGGAA